jgi:hypothetical protein
MKTVILSYLLVANSSFATDCPLNNSPGEIGHTSSSTIVTVPLWVDSANLEAIGVEFSYNPNYNLVSCINGNLIVGDWLTGCNELSPGLGRWGGFPTGGTPIQANSRGVLFILTFSCMFGSGDLDFKFTELFDEIDQYCNCDLNPCVTTSVENQSWGKIRARYIER